MKIKIIKSTILTFIWLVMTSTPTFAQPQGHPQGPPPIPDSAQIVRMVTRLKSELNLSVQQTQQLNKLFHDHFKEVRKKVEAQKTNQEKTREEMDKLRSSFENEIKNILNPDQQKKFAEFQKKHRPGPGAPPAKKE